MYVFLHIIFYVIFEGIELAIGFITQLMNNGQYVLLAMIRRLLSMALGPWQLTLMPMVANLNNTK